MRTFVHEGDDKFEISDRTFLFKEGKSVVVESEGIQSRKVIDAVAYVLIREGLNADLVQEVYVSDAE